MKKTTALRINRNGLLEYVEGSLLKDGETILVQNEGKPYPAQVVIDTFNHSFYFEIMGKRFPLRAGGGLFCPMVDINTGDFDKKVKEELNRLDYLKITKELQVSLFENFKWSISNGLLGLPGDYKFKDLSNFEFGNSCFVKANLDHTNFINSKLDGANFFYSTPWEAKFWKSSLLGANFSFISGWNIGIIESQISGADFYMATLTEAVFNKSIAAGTNFAHANLESATFVSANLCAANFFEANLDNVDFTGANLSRADLRSAKLEGTIISKKQLSSAITE